MNIVESDMSYFINTFPKICGITIFDDFHLKYRQTDALSGNFIFFKNEINRIKNYKNTNSLNSPKYLVLIMSFNISNRSVLLDLPKPKNNSNKCKYKNKLILSSDEKFLISVNDGKLVMLDCNNNDLNKSDNTWEICENKLKHNKTNNYITINPDYELTLTKTEFYAIKFDFENGYINYVKPDFRIKFDINNTKLKINPSQISVILTKSKNLEPKNSGINVCVLLAAGHSTRFGGTIPKQFNQYNGQELLKYSVDLFTKTVDKIIITTNSKYLSKVKKLIKGNKKISIVINDEKCRLKSIENSLNHISDNMDTTNINNLIIHDSARPFITEKYIDDILKKSSQYQYVQYSYKMTNGLTDINGNIYDNSKYIELCSPICAKYNLFSFLFENYIKDTNRISYELIPILILLQIEYNLIEGCFNILKKITYQSDLEEN